MAKYDQTAFNAWKKQHPEATEAEQETVKEMYRVDGGSDDTTPAAK